MTEFAAEVGGKLPTYRAVVDYLWQAKRDYPVFLASLAHCATCAASYEPYNQLVDQNLTIINQILDLSAPTIGWHQPDGASRRGHAVEAYFERDRRQIIEIGFYAIDTQIQRNTHAQIPAVQVPLEVIETLTESDVPDFRPSKPLYFKHGPTTQSTIQAPATLANQLAINDGRQFAGGATIDPRPA